MAPICADSPILPHTHTNTHKGERAAGRKSSRRSLFGRRSLHPEEIYTKQQQQQQMRHFGKRDDTGGETVVLSTLGTF